MSRLNEVIAMFQSVDAETRLDLLLDYSRRLPPISDRQRAERDAGLHRVPECQTPVFLWVEPSAEGTVHIDADVAPEAPTVRGFVSLLIAALNGAPASDFADIPNDLIHRLGLDDLLRMNRAIGLAAVLARIKHAVAHVATNVAKIGH